MVRPHSLWGRLTGWLTAPRAAALLLGVLGVLIGIGGYLYQYCACQDWPNLVTGWEQLFLDFYANVATTLVGITIAVLTIDLLNERRAEQQLQAQLIREMGSTDNGIALRAVKELRANQWLENGSLQEAELRGANLREADLHGADLREAKLSKANLQGADLTGAKLYKAYLRDADLRGKAILREANLQGASLENAKLQEATLFRADLRANLHRANLQGASLREANLQGAHLEGANLQRAHLDGDEQRTNLQGAFLHRANLRGADLFRVNLQGTIGLTERQLVTVLRLQGAAMPNGSCYDGRYNLSADTAFYTDIIGSEDPEEMARWYGVPLEDYLAGQEWARENLPRLRCEAGLDPDTSLPTQPANGTAPQPEELQSAAPSSSAPPRPVRSTRSLLSFTVRKLIRLFWPFGL